MARRSSPSSSGHAGHAERAARAPCACRSARAAPASDDQRGPHRHRVGEDRAASRGHLLHAEQHEPVPAGDVEEGEQRRPAATARAGCGSLSPESRATSEQAEAGERQREARNVSGAISVTPSFRTGQLQPQTSARTATGSSERPGETRAAARDRRQPRGGGGGSPYLLWCSARACVTHASRRMRPGNSGSLRVELVDVALAPARDLAVGGDAELLQHPLEHRADADDQLEVVGRAGTVEQRRRRVVLEIDDDLPVARGLARAPRRARASSRRRSSAKPAKLQRPRRPGLRERRGAARPPRVSRRSTRRKRSLVERLDRRRRGDRERPAGPAPDRRHAARGVGARQAAPAAAGATTAGCSGASARIVAALAQRAGAVRDDDADREHDQREQRESVHGGKPGGVARRAPAMPGCARSIGHSSKGGPTARAAPARSRAPLARIARAPPLRR